MRKLSLIILTLISINAHADYGYEEYKNDHYQQQALDLQHQQLEQQRIQSQIENSNEMMRKWEN